jgi:hypothetical protein
MNRMRYDAMGLGPYDLDMGEVALRELASVASFPFVCSNLEFQQDTHPWIRPYVLIERGRHTIAVISLLGPDPAVSITGARLIRSHAGHEQAHVSTRVKSRCLRTSDPDWTGGNPLDTQRVFPDVDVILWRRQIRFYQDTPRYIPAVAKHGHGAL